MNSIREGFKICCYELRIQRTSKRVWMGYLVGIAVMLERTMKYLIYVESTGEPVNVLEAFVIAGNNANTVMFLVLGWLLVISDAPFVNHNSFYMIYRTKRRNWNGAMLLYLLISGICYYSILAVSTIVFSMKNGFMANIWSSPFLRLAENGDRYVQYDISFPYLSLIQQEDIYHTFLHTFLLSLMYGMILGVMLYAFNLFSGRAAGVIAAFAFHFLGYEIMKEGFLMMIHYSMLARSIAALQISGGYSIHLRETYLIYGGILLFLVVLSNRMIKRTDFKEMAKEEGE